MDVVSNHTIPNQTIPNQNIPNWTNCKSSLKQPKQVGSWWKFHRSFSWMLSQTRPNHTIPYQTNCKSSKTAKTSRILIKLSQNLQMDVVSNQTKPYHTKPYHIKPNQTNFKSSLKQPKQVGSSWNFQRAFQWAPPRIVSGRKGQET